MDRMSINDIKAFELVHGMDSETPDYFYLNIFTKDSRIEIHLKSSEDLYKMALAIKDCNLRKKYIDFYYFF